MSASSARMQVFAPSFEETISPRGSIGFIGLATDRATVVDFLDFLHGVPGVGVYSTRVPMADEVNPETLRELANHIGGAARTIAPGISLSAIAFSCTSGSIAIGPDRARDIIAAQRPEACVVTPIHAALRAFATLGCRRISLLMPYLRNTAEMVAAYFESEGIQVMSCGTFDLAGDRDMNRLSTKSMVEAGRALFHPQSDALFISCTGLRTLAAIKSLEPAISHPVLSSNQVMAWSALREAGITDRLSDRGRLFVDR